MTYKINPKKKLVEQLIFLENSCNLFDQGVRCEAIRIAVVARVILHTTKNSTSLLSHLSSESIKLFTTISEYDRTLHFFFGTGMAGQNPDGSRFLKPSFNNTATEEFIPAKNWWEQLAFRLDNGHELTRKDIILSAANQDGGAHVDASIKDTYVSLATDGSGGTHTYTLDGEVITQNSEELHLVALRQFGYELLKSDELLKLAGR